MSEAKHKLKVYELVNPQDFCTVIAPDLATAAAAAVLMNSAFQARGPDGETSPEALPDRGESLRRWFREKTGGTLADLVESNLGDICAALRSLALGKRKEYEAALAQVPEVDREKFIEDWNDAHRTQGDNLLIWAYNTAQGLENRAVLMARKR